MKAYEIKVSIPREIVLSYNAESREEALEMLHNDMHIISHVLGADFDYEWNEEEDE